MTRKSPTDKLLAPKNGVHSRQELASRMRLNNITLCSLGKGSSHNMRSGVLTHKEDSGLRGALAYSSSGFDSAERWQAHI